VHQVQRSLSKRSSPPAVGAAALESGSLRRPGGDGGGGCVENAEEAVGSGGRGHDAAVQRDGVLVQAVAAVLEG
jgi:hypothetical protein